MAESDTHDHASYRDRCPVANHTSTPDPATVERVARALDRIMLAGAMLAVESHNTVRVAYWMQAVAEARAALAAMR